MTFSTGIMALKYSNFGDECVHQNMKMTWGMRRIKLFLYISNIILAIFGLCIVIVGTVAQSNSAEVDEDGTILVLSGTNRIVVFGNILFIMAFFGIWGVASENRWIVVLYEIGMGALVGFLVGTVISAISFAREDRVLQFRTQYTTRFKMYDDDSQTVMLIDHLQDRFKCCGIDGPSDFSTYFNKIPGSCCGKPKGSGCFISESYRVGCVSVLRHFLTRIAVIVASCAFLIATFSLVSIITAFVLERKIKKIQQAGRVVERENSLETVG